MRLTRWEQLITGNNKERRVSRYSGNALDNALWNVTAKIAKRLVNYRHTHKPLLRVELDCQLSLLCAQFEQEVSYIANPSAHGEHLPFDELILYSSSEILPELRHALIDISV